MKFYHRIILLFLISTLVYFNLRGIKWGIPSKERTELIFPKQFRNESFYLLMKQTRDDIYKLSGGSPIGRLKDSSSSLSPILQSTGVQENENLFFTGDKKMLANFIRPYLLRSNHTDEQMTIASLGGMHPKSFDFNPRIFQYGGVYIYGMGAWLGLSHVLGFAKISSDISFYFRQPEEMEKIFAAGRMLNSVFLIILGLTIFLIAKKIYSVNTALWSVLFFSVSPAFVFQSRIMKPYIMATSFSMLCLYYSVMIIKSQPEAKNYILSGIFTGLTAGTMPVYGIIIIAPLIAHFTISKKFNKNLLYVFLTTALVFVITNPYWIIKFNDAYGEIKSTGKLYATGGLTAFLNFFLYQLPHISSVGLLMVCLLGLLFAMLNIKKSEILLLSVGVIPLLIFGWLLKNQSLSMHNTRFLLPWLSIMLILASRVIDVFSRKKYVGILVIILVLFIVVKTALNSLACVQNFVIDSSANSTRLTAGRWIRDNIPANSIIGTNYMPEPAHLPPFDFSRYKIEIIRNYDIKKWPEYFICVNEVPKEILNGKNYTLTQSFKPVDKMLGIKFNIGYNHINSLVTIYKKI